MRQIFSALIALVLALPAAAQDRRPSHCIALADASGATYLHKASFGQPVPEFSVRIHYIHHASFLIQTRGGIDVATDFTGFLGRTELIPDVVTMNHAHETHFTQFPDPAIPHVLRGWATADGGNDHHLDLGEMLIRNVPTDIRSRFDAGVERNGNSIFVFEAEGLCIGHLGHLHHEPTAQQYAALGRLDVVMAAVDGGMTVDLPTMIRILKRLKSSVVIPMHWWGESNLQRFINGMTDEFDVIDTQGPSIEVSLRSLPDRPTVMVLRPQMLRDETAD
ncbi:MBL fold metallo-hydrolase [Nereida sp. MMG025]|uniref:MBL fold metallo-hydrolase n=1 Tax=Nereida sp. MMG025 TaxID=2909981 RepID=UPI001F1E52B5|nr:MBL fold metallo-hydrolase [Nereida sp. MMG025]MCF6445044.1 MBL fold metallo-hydrolase [Nereida sp. MMG025]